MTAPVEDIAALVADSLAMVKTAEARVAENVFGAYDRNFIVNTLIAYVGRLATALSQAEGRDPTEGNWINADDVDALVRRLDVALNGEEGAAKQARLCDIVSQVEHEAEGRGGAEGETAREPGMGWKLSPEARDKIETLIRENTQNAAALHSIVLASPPEGER